jgi:hypothetical protein
MLNPEFTHFCDNWLKKARANSGKTLEEHFDKFFTLYVVYNRAYAESTFWLSRNKQINIEKRTSFPDAEGATSYVLKFVTATRFLAAINTSPKCCSAIDEVCCFIKEGRFSIKLDMIYGQPQREKDLVLLEDLQSENANKRAHAVLDFIYSVRCNTFHGHKGFHPIQIDVLRPVSILLEKTIEIVLQVLNEKN